jgi:hypothetical protein
MSKLIIRAKSFRAWMLANFTKSELRDIADHGADTGWQYLTYYTETTKTYNRFKAEIWEMLLDDTESMGLKNPLELIASFNRADVGSCEQFENLLTWYAAEKIAREQTEGC